MIFAQRLIRKYCYDVVSGKNPEEMRSLQATLYKLNYTRAERSFFVEEYILEMAQHKERLTANTANEPNPYL